MADINVTQNNQQVTGQVSSLTGRWMKMLLGFSVSVSVGLAPYLGKLNVPLFTPMLSLIPASLQPVAIPLSAASMGLVAVLIQWYGFQHPGRRWLRVWFGRSIILCAVTLLAFAVIEMVAVVRIDVPAVDSVVSFAVGPYSPNKPPCDGLSREECIKTKLTLEEAKVNSYFGENVVNMTKLVMVIVYVAFMSMFGMLVGLV